RRHTRFSRDWSSDVCSSDLGTAFTRIRYKFEFSADKLSDLSLKDAWIQVEAHPYIHFRIGQFKSPFGRQRMVSSSRLQVIERAKIGRASCRERVEDTEGTGD